MTSKWAKQHGLVIPTAVTQAQHTACMESRKTKKAVVYVTFRHNEREYAFEEAWPHLVDPEDNSIEFWWTDGNGGCDCNRSISIAEHCDPDFPALDCGHEIELVSLEIEYQ